MTWIQLSTGGGYWVHRPVGPGRDAEQVDRKPGPGGGCGPGGGGAAGVVLVVGVQLQRIVEGTHHSHSQSAVHLLQDLLWQLQTDAAEWGLLTHCRHPWNAIYSQDPAKDPAQDRQVKSMHHAASLQLPKNPQNKDNAFSVLPQQELKPNSEELESSLQSYNF